MRSVRIWTLFNNSKIVVFITKHRMDIREDIFRSELPITSILSLETISVCKRPGRQSIRQIMCFISTVLDRILVFVHVCASVCVCVNHKNNQAQGVKCI